MASPDEEESGTEVVLAQATVGEDGTLALSVEMQKTEEDDEPAAPSEDGEGSVVGDLVGGAMKAAGGVLKAAGSVLGGLTSSSGDGDSTSNDS